MVRSNLPNNNSLIPSVKISVKVLTRTQRFTEECDGLPIPPSPGINQWGTRLEATTYYAKQFELITQQI
jgi:hypothetical protein